MSHAQADLAASRRRPGPGSCAPCALRP